MAYLSDITKSQIASSYTHIGSSCKLRGAEVFPFIVLLAQSGFEQLQALLKLLPELHLLSELDADIGYLGRGQRLSELEEGEGKGGTIENST